MRRQTLARWRNALAMLWLAVWLLPALVPPRSAARRLPDCCLGNGAHKCSLNAAGRPVVTVRCDAPVSKVVVGADLTALHSAPPPERTLCPASREALPDLVDRVPAPVFGIRSSRAPPSLV